MILARDRFLDPLNGAWANLPVRLEQLPADRRQAYLAQQGYTGCPGLLGHILSWWEDGIRVLERMRREPGFANPDYNVDEFNARAVERYGSLSTAEIIATYEAVRSRLVALVKDLSVTELNDERINDRLRYEVVVHLEEHPLPSL